MLADPPGGSSPTWASSRDFIVIHFDLLDAVGGSYPAAVLWSRILYRAGPTGAWRATRDQLAAETRLTPSAVRAAVRLLTEQGLIRSERATAFDPTLSYSIVWETPDGGVQNPPSRDGEICRHEDAESAITPLTKATNKQIRSSGPDEPVSALFSLDAPDTPPPPQDDSFETWWKMYPRKVSKGSARRAWVAAVRKTGPDVIMAGLARQARALAASHDSGFCPYPATWLNGERWADQPEPQQARTYIPSPTDTYDPSTALPPPPPRSLYA